MLKVIGQEAVGKTCLINACLGKKFEEDHDVTNGIAVIRTVSRNWTEDKDDSDCPTQLYTKLVTEKVRANESSPTIDVHARMNTDGSIEKKKDDKGNEVTRNTQMNRKRSTKNMEHGTEKRKIDVDGTVATEGTEIPFDTEDQLDKDTIEDIVQNKGGTFNNTFYIWDHGGQLIYHGIHRIFMTIQSLYVVVFDLSKGLDDPAKVIDSSGETRTHHWTNLQFILSFILTVYSHSRIVEEDEENEVHKPTILIVGTHKGKLGRTEEQQNVEAEKVFKNLKDVIKTKPYAKHVYHRYFAIENSRQTTDKSFSDLKEVIDELMTALEKEVPLKWMRFRCDLHGLRSNTSVSLCPLEKLKTLASKNGIVDENEQSVLLTFLYDLGEIIFMPDKRDQAVLNPMNLVETVKAFVTVIPSEIPTAIYRDAFDNLDKGILEEDLLRRIWKKRKVDVEKYFKFLVELMIQFGFICKMETTSNQDIESASTESSVKRSFFVPLRLAFKTSTEAKPVPDDSQSISVYYDFKGYLPDVLFPYTIIEFLNKFQKEGFVPQLSCDHAELYLDQYHHVTLSLVKFVTKKDERKFLLKMTIKRKEAHHSSDKHELSPEACRKALSTVEMSFEHSKDGDRRGIQFYRCIPCDCSCTSEKKHIQILENFQYEMLPCNGDGMDVTRYKRLFGDEIKPTKVTETDQVDSNQLEDKFNKLNDDLSEVFMKLKKSYLFLRCCLFEHIELQVLASQNSIAKSLFNELYAKRYIKPTDVSLLLEVVKLSENKYAEDLVKQYMEDNNVQNADEQKLSPYRKRLCRALTEFDPNELNKVNASYEMESLTIWDVVFALESKKKLADKSQKERFAELLGAIPKEILCADS
ncbi:uncharacterized protein [Antedon mediterranea]|uniref:uncharacterized protein n=1 Tax=Antedon mediterranea TaxID=105859 RepID=UPI003AF6C1BD